MPRLSRLLPALALGALMAGGALAPAFAQSPYPPPPPMRYEPPPPPPPGPRLVWQPGHWQWNGYRYAWDGGHYVPVRRGYRQFVPGHWGPRGGVMVWIPPHWR